MKAFAIFIILAAIFFVQNSMAQNVGIGTITPGAKLHIVNGASGYNSSYFPGMVIEGNSNTYLNFLTPNSSESAVLFGKASDASSGGIVYNNPTNLNGLQFRVNGNLTGMVINSAGNVGIGNTDPGYLLDVNNRMRIRSGGDLTSTAGIWLNNPYNTGLESFIGVETLNYVGFYAPVAGWGFGMHTTTGDIKIMSRLGIGTTSPNAPLGFPPTLGKKITLYPGATGDVGFAVAGNRLQIYSDNPSADVAIGYDAAGTFNERFAFKPNGALAINGNAGTTGQILQSNGSGAAPAWINAAPSAVHYIGESYGGGIVFFVYDNGQHGLIAASADQSTGVPWSISNSITNAVRDGIGAGKFNTERIINNQGAGAYAAQICANYTGGNYGDWYLPSKYELNLLYLQKAVVGGFPNSGAYWSSSEYNFSSAWYQYIVDGAQFYNLGKISAFYVRAIRAF